MSKIDDLYDAEWNRLRYWYKTCLIILFGGLVPAFLLSFPRMSREEDIFIPCWMAAVFFIREGLNKSFAVIPAKAGIHVDPHF